MDTNDKQVNDLHEESEIRDIGLEMVSEQLPLSAASIRIIKERLATVSKAYSPIAEELKKTMDKIRDTFAQNALNDFVVSFKGISFTINSIRKAISSFNLPTISTERREELLEAYEQWGSLGWTRIPVEEATFLFKDPPNDRKDADTKALKYCRGKSINRVFEEIRMSRRAKQSDFEEAVFDYNNKKYKSCALLLFSLIEVKFIRLQSPDIYRKTGLGAIKEAKGRTEENIADSALLLALECANIFSCLEAMFFGKDNFKTKPDVINRNYIDHGMLTKSVRQKDCIQLFLLYYNVLDLLDFIYQ